MILVFYFLYFKTPQAAASATFNQSRRVRNFSHFSTQEVEFFLHTPDSSIYKSL